jgi:hypothetical protein
MARMPKFSMASRGRSGEPPANTTTAAQIAAAQRQSDKSTAAIQDPSLSKWSGTQPALRGRHAAYKTSLRAISFWPGTQHALWPLCEEDIPLTRTCSGSLSARRSGGPADRPVTGRGTMQNADFGATELPARPQPGWGQPASLPMLYRTAWNAVCGGSADALAQNRAHSSAS